MRRDSQILKGMIRAKIAKNGHSLNRWDYLMICASMAELRRRGEELEEIGDWMLSDDLEESGELSGTKDEAVKI